MKPSNAPETARSVVIYDLKDQCGRCAEVVRESRMASCPYNQHAFPAAHNCPRFRYDWSDSNDHE